LIYSVTKIKYAIDVPQILENGDTLQQLLARSRCLLFKPESKWTSTKHAQAEILFERYLSLEQANTLVMQLGCIYHHVKLKGVAFSKAVWYDRVEKAGFKSFNVVVRSI
jgi:transposase